MITAEQEEALKASVMTLEHLDGLWVVAEDYIASEAARVEAEAATALVVERCAGARGLWLQFNSEGEPNGGYCTVEPHDPGDMKFYVSRDAIRSLASIDGVALLAELRAERDAARRQRRWNVDEAGNLVRLCRGEHDKSEDCGAHEEVFVPIAERDALAARLERLREALAETYNSAKRIDIGQSNEPDHWEFRCKARERAQEIVRLVDAALSEGKPATCRKCGGEMRPGIATGQTYTTGTPDFGPDDEISTMSAGGPGAVIPAMKCAACGWSVTP